MLKLYSIILWIAAAIMGISALIVQATIRARKNPLKTRIVVLFGVASVTCISYACAISTPNTTVVEWLYALYFICIDWLLVSMMEFTRQYTGIWLKRSIAPVIYCGMAILDNLSMLVNYRYHHAFTLKWVPLPDFTGCFIWKNEPYYYVHLTYCYILVLAIMLVLCVRTIKSSGFQKYRYSTLLAMVVLIVVTNAIFMMTKFVVDISVGLYVIATSFICYFTLHTNSKAFAEYMLSQVAERIECGLLAFDEADNCVYYNQLAARIFGQNTTKAIAEERFKKWRNGKTGNSIQNTNWGDVYVVDGEECRFDIHFTKIYDKKGQYSGCYFSFYDVTSDYIAYAEEKYRASHDSLTGALNRDSFYEEVRSLLDTYPTTEYVMVCADIKGFKLVNDMFGLDVGDKILVNIADEIRSHIKSGATFARLEADRFAVCMPKERYTEELFYAGCQKIGHIVNDSGYHMNILVGVYDIYDRNASVATMCDRAFLAIDSIKDSYSSQIAYYGEMLRNEYMNEQKIIGEFETALARGQFAMFLQPIVDRGGVVKFAEALVRWIHPEKGIIAPAGFVPVIENTGYIYKLDMYIWEQACKKLAYWSAIGYDDMSISVNISVKDFYYIDIYETLTDLVEKYHVRPEKLKLEITESVFMTEKDRQLEIMHALKDYGFVIEIDDFGSGYSSLNMLKEVPANILKIDMNFLSTAEYEDKGKKIINTIISLAKTLDMLVIVEGVETEEQVVYLRDSGANLFQGYFFDRPMPIKNFEDKYVKQ